MDHGEESWEKVEQHLGQLADRLRRLIGQPILQLGTLSETEVPESIGVYILYDQGTPTYVGKAEKIEDKASGKPSGLRFRIMYNHLGRAGDDNFLKYLGEEKQLDKRQAVQYVRQNYGCHWTAEVTTPPRCATAGAFCNSSAEPAPQ